MRLPESVKRFLYAIQTKGCLPLHLKKALGNPDDCNCDVLVLSYKQSCTADLLRHVKLLYQWLFPELAGRTKPLVASCQELEHTVSLLHFHG